MRYAIYFCPPPAADLARQAAIWLGRDAFSGDMLVPVAAGPLSAGEVAYHTAAARRYGFHATLKAPFRLAAGETEASLAAAINAFAADTTPPTIAHLALKQIDGFFALVPDVRTPELDTFAAAVVERFDRFRAPLTDADIARRNPETLSPRELQYLHKWGYPYVFEAFRFHMTLTGRVAGAEATRVRAAIEEHFGDFIGAPLEVDTLALFGEPDSGGPFQVLSIHATGHAPQRRFA
jgi:putative phosphonate metabolism protein